MEPIVGTVSFPSVFFWPFIYWCSPKVFGPLTCIAVLKSLDVPFHRLQQGLAVGTRFFHGRVQGKRLVEALQRLVASAQEKECDAHIAIGRCVARIDVDEALKKFQRLVVALLL